MLFLLKILFNIADFFKCLFISLRMILSTSSSGFYIFNFVKYFFVELVVNQYYIDLCKWLCIRRRWFDSLFTYLGLFKCFIYGLYLPLFKYKITPRKWIPFAFIVVGMFRLRPLKNFTSYFLDLFMILGLLFTPTSLSIDRSLPDELYSFIQRFFILF